jgi:hypothetical protein
MTEKSISEISNIIINNKETPGFMGSIFNNIKNNKMFLFIGLFLVASGYILYYYFFKNKSNNTNDTNDNIIDSEQYFVLNNKGNTILLSDALDKITQPTQPKHHQPTQPKHHQPTQPKHHQPTQPKHHQPTQPKHHQPTQPKYNIIHDQTYSDDELSETPTINNQNSINFNNELDDEYNGDNDISQFDLTNSDIEKIDNTLNTLNI